jgi:hypothetical protein
MKNTAFRIVLAFGIVILLSSCLLLPAKTYELVVNPNNPVEQNVEITFNSGFTLQKWNNNDISDSLYSKSSVSVKDITILTVPAGDNTFLFDLEIMVSNNNGSITHNFNNIELRYNLETRKKYEVCVYFQNLGFLKGYELGIEIIDTTKGIKNAPVLKQWKFGVF